MRFNAVLGLGLLLAALPGALTAGEKIKFSGRDDGNEAEKQLELQKAFIAPNFLPVRTQQPGQELMFMPRDTGTTRAKPTKAQLAEEERKRNWIFQKTDKEKEKDSGKSSEENKDETADGQQPQNSIERFLMESSRGNQASGRQGTNSVNGMRGREDRELSTSGYSGGSTNGIGGSGRSDAIGGVDFGSGPAGGMAPFSTGRPERLFQPLEGDRESRKIGSSGLNDFNGVSPNDSRLDEFRKLLAPTPVVGADLTTRELNPLTGRGIGAAGSEGSAFNLLKNMGDAGGANDGARKLLDPNAGGSTFAPVGDASRANTKPAVLDLPKRTF